MVGSVRLYIALAMVSLLLSMGWRGLMLPASTPDGFLMSFYQQVAGRVDGRSCPSYPVCSLYARQAIADYGLLTGSWLMLDRLIHEADDLHRGPWRHIDHVERLYDPLGRNTAWLDR